MRRILSEERGNTLVEIIMVMILLLLFGAGMSATIISGSNSERKLDRNRSAHMNARITMSYVNVWLKQNDTEGMIDIRENPITGENAIVITERDYPQFSTWIYFRDGSLWEYMTDNEDEDDLIPPEQADMANRIAEIDGFGAEYDPADNCITTSVLYEYSGEPCSLSSTVYLRTRLNTADREDAADAE